MSRSRTCLTLLVAVIFAAAAASVAIAQRGARPGGPGNDRSPGDVELEQGPLAGDEFEKKALAVLADTAANEQFRNVPEHDGRLLRIIALAMNAQHVVELGTSTGYSGLWFGLALKSTGGKLTTFEIDAERAATARENFQEAGMADIITVVEGDAHAEAKKLSGAIDVIFLDADKEGYIDYLDTLLPLLRPGGVVLRTTSTRKWPIPRS